MIALVVISVLFVVLLVLYTILLVRYNKTFKALSEFRPGQASPPGISVIIPARDEEKNIGACLDAMNKQIDLAEKPEIIVVNDHSEDETATIAKSHNAIVIDLEDESLPPTVAFKKWAIATGIRYSTGDLIVTTDADCIPGPEWLVTLASVIEDTKAVMVTGPVRMIPSNTVLSQFQSLDFAILQGITAASVHSGFHDMASGANLAYRKAAFNAVGGFQGIDDIATGDDMLLMQKISNSFPGRISYAFSRKAIVDTHTEPTWAAFFRQRIRWSSKATRYQDRKIFRILLLVYLLNLCMLAYMLMAFLSPIHFSICLAAFMLKTMAEWNFVDRILRFFSLSALMKFFPFFQPLHVLYTVISGGFGQLGTVAWKGRKVK